MDDMENTAVATPPKPDDKRLENLLLLAPVRKWRLNKGDCTYVWLYGVDEPVSLEEAWEKYRPRNETDEAWLKVQKARRILLDSGANIDLVHKMQMCMHEWHQQNCINIYQQVKEIITERATSELRNR